MSSVIRDEEQRISRDHLAIFIGTEDNCSVDDNGRFSSILSSEPSFGSENEDHVPELASLINDNDGITSYGSNMNENEPSSLLHHRTLSDDSIATVAALSGMVLRAHSVTVGNRGCCVIRHSDPKIALKAAQLERRLFRNRLHNPQPIIPQQPSSPLSCKECYWLDIETIQRSSDELYEFLKQLRLPRFFDSILSDPTLWTSDVTALKFTLLAIFQILPLDPESNEISYVALLSMPRLLVTFSTVAHTQNNDSIAFDGLYNLTSQYMRQRERVQDVSNTGLLLAWMQYHVRRTSRAIRELRAKTLELDELFDSDSASFDFDEMVTVKNLNLRVLAVAEEQHGTVEALTGAEGITAGLDFSNCHGSLSILRATASSNERLSSRVEKHLNDLRERIMAQREQTLNRRLGLLTILSAIFMPLTLLSGIWGMNFESMPELSMEGAYQKALFGMLMLSLCLLYSFHRAGWTS